MERRDSVAVVIQGTGLDALGDIEGWIWARGWPDQATDLLLNKLAGRLRQPGIGGWVFDSDFGGIAAVGPDDGPSAVLAVKEPYDTGSEGSRYLAEQWRSLERRRQAACDLERWSTEYAPSPIPAEDVVHALRDDEDTSVPGMGPVLAEDAIREIFDGMGFPSLDLTVFR